MNNTRVILSGPFPYNLSIIIALPIPPPTHSEATSYLKFLRIISCRRVITIRAPEVAGRQIMTATLTSVIEN